MRISIYKNAEGRYCVDYYKPDGKRVRRAFPTKQAATLEKESVLRNNDLSSEYWNNLSSAERSVIVSALAEISQSGESITSIWSKYKTFSNVTTVSKKLGAAIAECVASKKENGRRPRYTDSLFYALTRFAQARESVEVRSIHAADIEQFIAKMKSPWTKATWINRLSTLFSFSVRRGWITQNPCDQIERMRIDSAIPKILSLADARKLMLHTQEKHPKILAWMTLALFCGVRPEEADRVDWSCIDKETGYVMLDAGIVKTHKRRLIHSHGNAAAWFAVARKVGSSLPLSLITRRRHIREIRDFMGWDAWPHDILRKTCASYWMGEKNDAGIVSNELGNSASILLRHYRELVDPKDSAAFFSIMPSETQSPL